MGRAIFPAPSTVQWPVLCMRLTPPELPSFHVSTSLLVLSLFVRLHGCSFSAISRRHNLTENLWLLRTFHPLFWNNLWTLSVGNIVVDEWLLGSGLHNSKLWSVVVFCSGLSVANRRFLGVASSQKHMGRWIIWDLYFLDLVPRPRVLIRKHLSPARSVIRHPSQTFGVLLCGIIYSTPSSMVG